MKPITKIFFHLDHILAIFEKALVVGLFSILILMIGLNVVSRNLLQFSFQGILEFSPALVVWLALMGSSLALQENRHIKIEILLRFASQRFRKYAHVITAVFGMAVAGILLGASIEFVVNEIAVFQGKGWITLIFPWFFLVSFFRFMLKLMQAGSISGGRPDDPKAPD